MKQLPVVVKIFALLMVLMLSTTQTRAEVYIRQTIILTPQEQEALIRFIQQNDSAHQLWLDIRQQADSVLADAPDPQERIHYEGLLDTNSKRIQTEQALEDMDKLAQLLFAYYGSGDTKYVEKTKQFIMAWVRAYKATGNPINENKFEPLIHCYYVMKSAFTVA
ncbi:MAG: hypothetical protein U5K69_19530 [Balneolaceae bacterium]|nr:hypothetical protein [Balneolaceae bacterium]